MSTLKDRLSGQLQEMVAERSGLDEQIKQLRGVIGSLDGASAASRRKPTARRRRRPTPVSSEQRAAQIIEHMKKAKAPVTTQAVAKGLGVSGTVVRKTMDNLVKAGQVKEAGMAPRPEGQRGGRESKLFSVA